ncbi:MAG: NAD(P)/FAD-dependent oxidoreductase [Burkholderiaceae bacterium]
MQSGSGSAGSSGFPQRHVFDVAIVGAGFGGLCMAIALRRAGNDDFVILEKAADVGGTWLFNHYPGAACDIQSHLYSFSFAGKADWSERYAGWREIHQYLRDTVDRHGIRPFVRFGRVVNAARFDEEHACWNLQIRGGDAVVARHFVMATGPLHVPFIPDIPGLATFSGKAFHSAQWAHDVDLAGQRVASIGTGASAIQYLPEIASKPRRLYVFQRTPAWVMPRMSRRYLGAEKALFARFPGCRKLHRARLYWSNEARMLFMGHAGLARPVQALARRFIRHQVKDRALAARLTPDYLIGCKRILLSNTYYPIFRRANVDLVTEGIREIREDAIVTADGISRPVDCLIFATGFVADPRRYLHGFPIHGRSGRVLQQDWSRMASSYYGVQVAGYPNFHQLIGPNTGLGHNSMIFMIEAQVRYVMQCMALMKERGAASIEIRQPVQDAFNARLQTGFRGSVWTSGCRSWYQDADGGNFALWPYSTCRFWLETRTVSAQDYLLGQARAAGATLA